MLPGVIDTDTTSGTVSLRRHDVIAACDCVEPLPRRQRLTLTPTRRPRVATHVRCRRAAVVWRRQPSYVVAGSDVIVATACRLSGGIRRR